MVIVPTLCAKSMAPLALTFSCMPKMLTSIDIDMSADCEFIVCAAALATASCAEALPDPPRTTAVLTPPATKTRAAAAMPYMTWRARRSRLACCGPVAPKVGGAHAPDGTAGTAASETGWTGAPSGAKDDAAAGATLAGGGTAGAPGIVEAGWSARSVESPEVPTTSSAL